MVVTECPSTKLRGTKTAINYYAGFSEAFVDYAIDNSVLKKGSLVLDPWNGSGTTTAVATKKNLDSIGIDINPATLLYAYARLASKQDLKRAKELFLEIRKLKVINSRAKFQQASDLNFLWFTEKSTYRLNAFRENIFQIEDNFFKNLLNFIAVKVFRMQLDNFLCSNPTWIKRPKEKQDLIEFDFKRYLKDFEETIDLLMINAEDLSQNPNKLPRLELASSLTLPLKNSSVDCIVTSPPYCTRIDYAIMTLPELVWLKMSFDDIKQLRRDIIGTTTVEKSLEEIKLTPKAQNILNLVQAHDSKASATYYYKNLKSYFIKMELSFLELARVLKKTGSLHIVLQDSKYKDLDLKISEIFAESLEMKGLQIIDQSRYMSEGFNYLRGNREINEVVFRCRKKI
ncbi:MAG: DNA methyltransferase [Candidatus Melainabacteria bacterium]|nr:DNA methyltransferase [Candidatus Melainabacteria bacterium]